jgi:hypothetical protein
MFNSLLIYHPTNTKKQRNIRLYTIDVYLQIYISIFQKIIFHKKQLTIAKCLSPDRNKKCWSFHIIYRIIAYLQTFPHFRQKMLHILSSISNPFHLMQHHIHKQINQPLNIKFRLLG